MSAQIIPKTLILILFVGLVCSGFGQTGENLKEIRIDPRPCEFNNIELELANKFAGPDSILILIARPGIDDKNLEINRRRLHTAVAYLVEYTKLRSPESVVVGVAPESKRLYYGGIEIYVKGKLQSILTSKGDKDLSLGDCSGFDVQDQKSRERMRILYPWSDRHTSQ